MSTDTSSIILDEKHPLVLELASLKQAVSHYQLEAHKAKQQLQHQFNESRSASQHSRALEDEIKTLQSELSVHRSHSIPDDNTQQATLQAQELSLALRRLSDKLDLTERNLADCKERLSRAVFERDAAVDAKESVLDVLVDLRQELDKAKAENRELNYHTKLAEEQARISNIAVEEYASLVRSMEGRAAKSAPQSPINEGQSSMDGLHKARSGLQTLLKESNEASEKLHVEIALLHRSLEELKLKYDSQIQSMEQCTRLLAETQAELISLKNDDNTAAKMVSRYMKFSQSSTDALYGMLDNLKKRHESTVESYKERIRYLEESRASERRQCEHFLRILDELTEDISRESYGRRREIFLRMEMLAKEQLISEKLRRWTLRAHEKLEGGESAMTEGQHHLLNELLLSAGDILSTVDSGSDDAYSSYARLVSAADAVNSLQKELQSETDKRLILEQQLISVQEVVSEREELFKRGIEGKLRLVHMTLMPSLLLSRDKLISRTFEDNSVQTVLPTPLPTESFSEASPLDTNMQTDTIIPPSQPTVATNDIVQQAEPPTSETSIRSVEENTTTLGSSQSAEVADSSEGVVNTGVVELGIEASNLVSGNDEDKHIPCPVASTPFPSDSLLLSGNFPQEHWFKAEDTSGNLHSPIIRTKSIDTSYAPSSSMTDIDILLSKLLVSKHRYDGQQKQLQGCSLSLQEMKQDFMSLTEKPAHLLAILDRLFDFCEDSKVELEIRISDEERVIRGYQTLLSIPGALSDELDEAEVKRNIEDFVDGRDPAVRRAQETTQHKLEDLLHDIASVKQALHDHQFPTPEGAKGYTINRPAPETASWTSWTGSLLSSSRSPSPAPSFGAVMTSPKLRRSSSSQHLQPLQDSSRNNSNLGSTLNLRIHMPFLTSPAPTSRQAERVRPRVISTAFGVGIRGGFAPSRAASFTLNRPNENTTRPSIDYNNDVE